MLLQQDWDGGKLFHGWVWAALMPQVSASTGGDSLSMQAREGKALLQCHPPQLIDCAGRCAQSSRTMGSERLHCCPLPVLPFLENGGQVVIPHLPSSVGLAGSLVTGHP